MPEQTHNEAPRTIPTAFLVVDGQQTVPETNNNIQIENSFTSFFQERRLLKVGKRRDLWALGVGVVIAGQSFGWNRAACSGLGGLLIAFAIVALLYNSVVHCLAEITSILPVSGSIFSFVRDVWGPFWGWAVGLLETLEWTLTSSAYLAALGDALSAAVPSIAQSTLYSTATWCLMALGACAVNLLPGRWLWNAQMINVVLTLGIMTLVIALSIPQWDPLKFGLDGGNLTDFASWFPDGGFTGVLRALPMSMWLFLGIESVPFASEEAAKTQDIAPAMVRGMRTLSASALPIIFSAIFLPFGPKKVCLFEDSVLLHSLDMAVGNPTEGPLRILIQIAAMIPLWTSLTSTILVASRIAFSLSRSGYLSTRLSKTTRGTGSPSLCTVFATIGCLVLAFCGRFSPSQFNLAEELVLMSVTVGSTVYIIIGISYLQLQQINKYYSAPHKSSWGRTGAWLSISISLVIIVTMVGMEWEQLVFLGTLGGVLALGCCAFFAANMRRKVKRSVQTRFGILGEVEYVRTMQRMEKSEAALKREFSSSRWTIEEPQQQLIGVV